MMLRLPGVLLLILLGCWSQATAQDRGLGLGVLVGEPTGLSEVVASFTSGGTASNLGIERCGKINGLNSGSETWTGIGVVAGFLAGMGMIEWFYLKITKLPKKTISSNIIIC